MLIKKLPKFTIKVKKHKKFYLALVMLALFFVAGFVHNNNIAYISMFFVFAVLFVGMIMGRLKIKKADVFIPSFRIFAKEEIEVPFFEKEFNILPEYLMFDKRGIKKVHFTLSTDYPLGIATFYKTVQKEFLVYPSLEGVSLKEAFGGGRDFEGLKQYEGESMKYIHWASVAKGEIKSKKFASEESFEAVFYYDFISGDKEKKISQLALWAFEAFRENISFKIVLPDKVIDSKEGFDEVFKKLALY